MYLRTVTLHSQQMMHPTSRPDHSLFFSPLFPNLSSRWGKLWFLWAKNQQICSSEHNSATHLTSIEGRSFSIFSFFPCSLVYLIIYHQDGQTVISFGLKPPKMYLRTVTLHSQQIMHPTSRPNHSLFFSLCSLIYHQDGVKCGFYGLKTNKNIVQNITLQHISPRSRADHSLFFLCSLFPSHILRSFFNQ